MATVEAVNTVAPVLQFVHVDHLHRPVKMTNTAKATVWDAVWQPFGGLHSMTGAATNNLRFPGQWFQSETGLHYNWHRSYDPTLGRYTQPDPLGFVDGPSVCAYARSNPNNNVDPTGQFAMLPLSMRPLLLPPAPPSSGGSVDCPSSLTRHFRRSLVEQASWKRLTCAAALARLGVPARLIAAICSRVDDDNKQSSTDSQQPPPPVENDIPVDGPRDFTPTETEALRNLFGKGPDGARDLLRRLEEGPVNLPPGASRETLENYASVAKKAIDAGKDKIGVQELRLRAIQKLLGK